MILKITSADANQQIIDWVDAAVNGDISKEDITKNIINHICDVYSWGREDEAVSIIENSKPPLYTPEPLLTLKPHEYTFVGTNPEGRSGLGFAKYCVDNFYLQYGVSKGLSGQCYGIVTKDLQATNKGIRSIPLDNIQRQILTGYDFIKNKMHPGTVWYMPKIGCGLAGYHESELQNILENIQQYKPKNVILPKFS
jgi:hypothetical protein